MQDNAKPLSIVLYPSPVIDGLHNERANYSVLQSQIDYMASRLRAALHAYSKQTERCDNERWWLEWFRYEMVRP